MTPLHYFTLLKLKVILLLSRMPILLYLFHQQDLECITEDSASNKHCQAALWHFSFLKQGVIVPFSGSSKAFNSRLGGSVTLHCNPPPQHASPPPAWLSAAAFPNPQQHRPQQLLSFDEKKREQALQIQRGLTGSGHLPGAHSLNYLRAAITPSQARAPARNPSLEDSEAVAQRPSLPPRSPQRCGQRLRAAVGGERPAGPQPAASTPPGAGAAPE